MVCRLKVAQHPGSGKWRLFLRLKGPDTQALTYSSSCLETDFLRTSARLAFCQEETFLVTLATVPKSSTACEVLFLTRSLDTHASPLSLSGLCDADRWTDGWTKEPSHHLPVESSPGRLAWLKASRLGRVERPGSEVLMLEHHLLVGLWFLRLTCLEKHLLLEREASLADKVKQFAYAMRRVGLTGRAWPELESSLETHQCCPCQAEAKGQQALATAVVNCCVLSSGEPAEGPWQGTSAMTRLDPPLCMLVSCTGQKGVCLSLRAGGLQLNVQSGHSLCRESATPGVREPRLMGKYCDSPLLSLGF